MRKGKCNNRDEQDMGACDEPAGVLVAPINPPCTGQGTQQMFVRAPGENFRGPLGLGPGMRRNGIGDRYVGGGRTNLDRRHVKISPSRRRRYLPASNPKTITSRTAPASPAMKTAR